MSLDLEQVKKQEEKLQFSVFDKEIALDIGVMLLETARKEKLPVEIDITVCDHQLFHASLPGSTADNSAWIKRKRNCVKRFEISSMQLDLRMKEEGKSIEEAYNIDSDTYAAAGGSFPVIVRNTGVIGAVTVSGLTSEEDHCLVVKTIEEYLTEKCGKK